MMKKLFLSLILVAGVALFNSQSVSAAPPTTKPNSTPLGIDVSWPQCYKRLPTNQAFGIVGINNGFANDTNPCLLDQLIWAGNSIGGANQEIVQLYVNTANPGPGVSSWPKSNVDPFGNIAPNPGQCEGNDSLACAWQYGWNRAAEDVIIRFQPVVNLTGLNPNASNYIWWLDVETENSWKLSGTIFDNQSNVAVLEGMASYFKSASIRIGLYSTGSQWSQIAGQAVGPNSNLNGLPNWRPGGASLNTSKQACSALPLTINGSVVMTQFVSKGLDYNYSCI